MSIARAADVLWFIGCPPPSDFLLEAGVYNENPYLTRVSKYYNLIASFEANKNI
jgi:hypothetical protein